MCYISVIEKQNICDDKVHQIIFEILTHPAYIANDKV